MVRCFMYQEITLATFKMLGIHDRVDKLWVCYFKISNWMYCILDAEEAGFERQTLSQEEIGQLYT